MNSYLKTTPGLEQQRCTRMQPNQRNATAESGAPAAACRAGLRRCRELLQHSVPRASRPRAARRDGAALLALLVGLSLHRRRDGLCIERAGQADIATGTSGGLLEVPPVSRSAGIRSSIQELKLTAMGKSRVSSSLMVVSQLKSVRLTGISFVQPATTSRRALRRFSSSCVSCSAGTGSCWL